MEFLKLFRAKHEGDSQWHFELPVLISGDSRKAALVHYNPKKVPYLGKLLLMLSCVGISVLLSNWVGADSFNLKQQWILLLLFLAVALWITEAIPPFATGLLIIVYLVYTQGTPYFVEEPVDTSKYTNTWASPVIWLLLGGFFLARAMEKTGLDISLFRRTVDIFGARPNRLLLGLMLTTSIASMLLSNTATSAMMIASIMPLIERSGPRSNISKRFLLGIPAAASVGGMGTIIGSPPNAVAVGALQSYGVDIDFLEWMTYGIPVALLLSVIFWSVLIKRYPTSKDSLDLSFIQPTEERDIREKRKRTLVLAVLAITVGLWISSPLHALPVAVVSILPIALLTMFGVLWAQDVRKLPWDTLMLVAGSLALGLALIDSGIAEYYLGQIRVGEKLWMVCAGLSLVTMLVSNVMSNTAAATILIPLGLMLMGNDIAGGTVLALVIALTASTALFLPVSTPPNAIAFSTGHIRQQEFRLGGFVIGFGGPVLIILWVMLLAV